MLERLDAQRPYICEHGEFRDRHDCQRCHRDQDLARELGLEPRWTSLRAAIVAVGTYMVHAPGNAGDFEQLMASIRELHDLEERAAAGEIKAQALLRCEKRTVRDLLDESKSLTLDSDGGTGSSEEEKTQPGIPYSSQKKEG